MGESIKRKKNLISIILVLGIIFSILGVTKYNKVKAYNRLISEGNKYLQSENYDKAIKLFTESLNYKNDSNVENILINAKKLKNDKKFFDQGVDFSGHVYKDTYPSNLQCVKAKKATDEAKDDKISKKQAEDLAREVSKKDSEISKINYQGISKVPFDNIDKSKSPYRIFPKEIMNKEVYVFEGINGNSEDNYVTACMYYIDLGGNVYKDTLPSNGECIRIK